MSLEMIPSQPLAERMAIPAPRPAAGWIAPALVCLTLLAGLAVSLRPVAAQQQSKGAEASPYTKWLNEDVVYIIRPEERAAFKRLRTDEEREKFIEQFWQRRDPSGKAKKEHYRRIAYVNEHFKEKNLPGWKTDRGRLYIMYGPPDEIESHPANNYEQWLYHEIPGIGKNVIIDFRNGVMTRDPHAQ